MVLDFLVLPACIHPVLGFAFGIYAAIVEGAKRISVVSTNVRNISILNYCIHSAVFLLIEIELSMIWRDRHDSEL